MSVPAESFADDARNVSELLIPRDELLQLVEAPNVNPVEKDFALIDAARDPYFGPAVTMNGLLQQLANHLHERARPELHLPYRNKDWADRAISHLYEHEGDFDPVFDLSDQIINLHHLRNGEISREEATAFMRTMMSRMIHAAHRAALMAESYRRHNVGVRGFYIDEKLLRAGMFSSYNVKPHALEAKLCGERFNLEMGEEEEFTYCVGLVIMSLSPQVDPGSKKPTAAEPPCGVCRLDLATNPLVDSNTFIMCVAPNGKYDEYTVGELLKIHGCPT